MDNIEVKNTKKCSECENVKSYSEFHVRKDSKDGYGYLCKDCYKKYCKINKEKRKIVRAKHYKENKEKIDTYNLNYYHSDKERAKKIRKNWVENNKDEYKKYQRNYLKEKRKTDIRYALHHKISSLVGYSLKGNKNGICWETLVGYNKETLKKHLENQFQDGMTWDKYLSGELEIDHILPMELFNFSSHEDKQFKICWNLNNLRPLWKKDNRNKSDILDNGQHARHLSDDEKLNYLKSKGYNVI